ncbi:phosphotransferase [Streptomyces sp. NBC_01565]|uniref:phosphotransferase enzyme family protein n=1 Tax=unclassified Streptomyces TaxID=2593676 RepID=UPI0022572494|nr:phosphotransferase [Streptomyces sp. NBC_01565]MCX4546638.1 phosphotransferase [Streptomyces sp. NBC_01565]
MPISAKPDRYGFFAFDGGLLHQLSDAYGLGPLTGFRPVLLDGDHVTLIDIRSQTSRKMVIQAANGSRLFLKQIPWYCEPDTLTLATAWQTQATAAGLPVPRILRTTEGRAWYDIGGSSFTLTEYVPGRRYADTPRDRAQAGRTMALLHSTPAEVPTGPTEDAFAGALEHIALTPDLTTAPTAALDLMRHAVRSWASQAAASGWGSLAGQLTHGDTNPWNLIYTDIAATLIDFDNAHRGPSVRDVAEAVLSFCAVRYRQDTTNFAPAVPGRIDRGQAADILTAYTRVRGLTPQERACLPLAGGAVAVGLVCLGLMRGDYPQPLAHDLAMWATGVPDDMTRLLAQVCP